MIAYLKGIVLEFGEESIVLEAGGVGYEVHVPRATLACAAEGSPLELFICESTALYGGGTTLYGFATREERELFLCLREAPNTGAKKALEHLDKAARSLPDFRRAVLDEDARMLSTVFGFTPKTAERLVVALKDRFAALPRGAGRRAVAPASDGGNSSRALQRALDALLALGYKSAEARAALQSVVDEPLGRAAAVEDIIRMALKRL